MDCYFVCVAKIHVFYGKMFGFFVFFEDFCIFGRVVLFVFMFRKFSYFKMLGLGYFLSFPQMRKFKKRRLVFAICTASHQMI